MPPVARTRPIPPPTPELLTESFCERCGTRYTFESAAPKARRTGLTRARVLTRGLRNWVVEDGRSIDAAMADARRDEERGLASAQLEAFHQTFNFCMDCRQYTCLDCWNPGEGRCRSCAPMAGDEEDEATATAQATAIFAAGAAAANGADAPTAWPTLDLAAEAAAAPAEPGIAELDTADFDTAEPVAEARPYMPTELRPVELPDDDLEAQVEAVAAEGEVVEMEAVATAEAETIDVEAIAPEETIEAEAVAVEPEVVEVEAVVAEVEVEPEPVVEPEVVEVEAVAEVESQLEPVAEPEPEPVAAAEPPARPAPAWTIVAPDTQASPGEAPTPPAAWPPAGPVYQPPPSQPAAGPATPDGQPSWPTVAPAAMAAPVARSVWEESSLGVIAKPGSGVQACVSCGLPLSATARFCRRCGTRQG